MSPVSPAAAAALLAVLAALSAPQAAWAGDETAYWLGGDGVWIDAARWSTPVYPTNGAVTYDVMIDAGGVPYTVTLDNLVSVDSVTVDSPDATLFVGEFGVLDVVGDLFVRQGRAEMAEGTITRGAIHVSDGAEFVAGGTLGLVSLSGTLMVHGQETLTVYDGLTLDGGVVALGRDTSPGSGGTALTFRGTQTLGGSGEVVFDGDWHGVDNLRIAADYGGTLTIGPGVTVRTGQESGVVGGTGRNLINEGLISAQTPGQVITVTGDTWTNRGVLEARNGAVLRLKGEFQTADLGTMRGDDKGIQIWGTLDNTGQTLTMNAETGSLVLLGEIRGGTIAAEDGRKLNAGSRDDTFLDGVTLSADMSFQDTITIRNGLVLDGATISTPYQTSHPTERSLVFTGAGHQDLTGSGELLARGARGLGVSAGDGAAVRIGPDITMRIEDAGYFVFSSSGSGAVTNGGHLTAQSQGARVAVKGRFTNDTSGVLEVGPGATVEMGGDWDNNGILRVDGGTLRLDGTFSPGDIGTLDRQGGTVEITGTLVDGGTPLTLNTLTGDFVLAGGGKIVGATVSTRDGAKLACLGYGWRTLDGVTLDGLLLLGDGTRVDNSLTLTDMGVVQMLGSTLWFRGDQALGGSGEIVFDGESSQNSLYVETGGRLTVEPGVTIRTGAQGGRIGGWSLTNQGTIEIGDGKTVELHGGWTNEGTIRIDHGTLKLEGSFTTPGMGTIENNDGLIEIRGRLDNTGHTLSFGGGGGTLRLGTGGQVVGGTIASTGGSVLYLEGGPKLDGVTLATDSRVRSTGVSVENGLALSGTTMTFDASYGNAGLKFYGTGSLSGTGEIVFNGAGSSYYGYVSVQEGTVTIDPGITIRTGAQDGRVTDGGSGVLVSHGQIRSEQAGRTMTFRGINEGDIIADNGGNLTILGTANRGTISIAGGGLLKLESSTPNEGTIRATDSTVLVRDATADLGDFAMTGGTLWLAHHEMQEYTTAFVRGFNCTDTTYRLGYYSAVDNTGDVITLDPAGSLWELDGGKIRGGTITGIGGAALVVGITSTWTNELEDVILQAPLVLNPGRRLLGRNVTASDSITANGDEIKMEGTWSAAGPIAVTDCKAIFDGQWSVTDSITFTGDKDMTLKGTWTNDGAISWSGHELFINGEWTNNGSILATDGMVYLNGSPIRLGDLTVDGAALRLYVDMTTQEFRTIQGLPRSVSLEDSCVLDNTGQTLDMNALEGDWSLHGATIIGGVVASSDGVVLKAKHDRYGGGGTLQGVELAADMELQFNSDVVVRDGLSLNDAAVTLHASYSGTRWTSLLFEGTQTLSGTGQIVFGGPYSGLDGSLLAPVNGTLTVGPGIVIRTDVTGGTVGDAGQGLVNQGVISARTSGKTVDVLAATLGNTGVLEATGGGTLTVATGNPFANEGTLAAGAGGLIDVAGDLTQAGGAAALNVEIGGTVTSAFGRLAASGEAGLAGALNIAVVDGFVPEVGDEFEILTCGSRSGMFDEVTGWLTNGLALAPIYEDQRVYLHATFVGDANLDGQVGIADLVALADHYGLTGAAEWADADFNLDGHVGIADLVALADHYGDKVGGGTVPEPAGLALLVLGGMLLAGRRRGL
ncbi:MAG: hypothetical protein ACYS5V_00265 [Planctomycetota bacterium]|jgi:hypothetical protein